MSWCGGETIKVWDARPLSPEVLTDSEARSLVKLYVSKGITKTEVIENLLANSTITESVRQKALAVVEDHWNGAIHQKSSRLVCSLFDKPMVRQDILDCIRENNALSQQVRREALALAEHWRASAGPFYNASWAVVRKADADASTYLLALRQAEEACRLAPEVPQFLELLGAAQYRTGKYEQAASTLAFCDQLSNKESERPAYLAFLAMAHCCIGRPENAQDCLNRLRERMKDPAWANMDDMQSCLHEAETLLQAQTEKSKK
jgi:hypothetical protein